MEIKHIKEPFNIDVKRFYPPVVFTDNCPICKSTVEFDGYLSYPRMNIEEEVDFYCYTYDEGWTRKVIMKLEVKEVE